MLRRKMPRLIIMNFVAFVLTACSISFRDANFEPLITGIAVQNNQLVLTGSSLGSIVSVSSSDPALSGYSFSVSSQSETSLLANALHTTGTALTLAVGSTYNFLVSSAEASTIVSFTIASSIPTGAIMAFQGACPSGWSAVSASSGRVLVGAGSGNLDALGAALTNRTLASTGGLEYTTGMPASTTLGNLTTPSSTSVLAASHGSGASNGIYIDASATNTTLSGPAADSNLPPYLVVNYCSKN